MRIVAGRFKGKAIVAPETQATRPTSDRLRETVFNILMHGVANEDQGVVAHARVLDLFAGTGALGLEAMSRGAKFCVFIEDGVEARGVIRRNVEACALNGATKIFRRDATQLGEAGTIEPFSLVFLDPPYDKGLGEKALSSARKGGWLQPGAICVLEERASAHVTAPEGFSEIDSRTVGDSQVIFLRNAD